MCQSDDHINILGVQSLYGLLSGWYRISEIDAFDIIRISFGFRFWSGDAEYPNFQTVVQGDNFIVIEHQFSALVIFVSRSMPKAGIPSLCAFPLACPRQS